MSDSQSLLDVGAAPALNPQSLSFQDFSTSSRKPDAGAGSSGPPIGASAIGGGMGAPMQPTAAGGFGEDPSATRNAAAAASGFWSLKYYQPLFDVDTVQVLSRIKGALLPRPKGAFFESVAPNPDLYGPFWISTTLIFTMAMSGNLASFASFVPTPAQPKWTYNFNQLTLAGSVVYSYVTLLPMLFWMLLRYYEASKKLVDVLCIYGYTLSIFIPISILSVVPSNFLRWLLVLLGGGVSAIFLLSNFHAHLADCFPYGEGDAKRKMYLLLGAMGCFHVMLLFLFKLYFFHYA